MLNLTNHFLIATPDLEDSLFSGSLVYICEHTSDGAMGLIVNKPSPIGMEIVFAGAGCKHIPKNT
nr:YqgE/AlgH family protein [Alysiella crassa]